ncbi:MAG TPA: DUF952 domain-containing protein [Micromonosporaceae bacterium]
MLIYKILLPSEWAEFDASGTFTGSPFDHESGFIHLSSADQVAATASRIFGDAPELIVVAIDDASVADALRWEDSDNHGRFPHLYGSLSRDDVDEVRTVAGAAAVTAF